MPRHPAWSVAMGRMLVLALILLGLGGTLLLVVSDEEESLDADIEDVEEAGEVEDRPPAPTRRPARERARPAEENPPTSTASSDTGTPPVAPTQPAGEDAAKPEETSERPALATRPVADLDEETEWTEGESTKKAFVDPRVLVEFAPTSDEANQPIAPALGAQLIADGRPRVWLLEEIGETSETISARATAEAQLAPLLHAGSSTTSAARAPTGRLYVKLDAEWDEETAKDFASRNDLSDFKTAGRGPGWWVAYAGPGLQALEKATALQQLDEVLECRPDFWQAPARK